MLPKRQSVITKQITLPLSKRSIVIKPFKTRQEKELMMMKETASHEEILDSLVNLAEYCTVSGVTKVDQLEYIDFMYLFLESIKLSKSTRNIVEYQCKNKVDDEECDGNTNISIDLSNYKVVIPEGYTNQVKYPDMVITMKSPTIEKVKQFGSVKELDVIDGVAHCIESIATEEEIYDDFTFEEIKNFVLDMSPDEAKRLSEYFKNLPTICIEVPFKCSKCGVERTLKYDNVIDFFVSRS